MVADLAPTEMDDSEVSKGKFGLRKFKPGATTTTKRTLMMPYETTAYYDATQYRFTGKERDTESENDYFEAEYYHLRCRLLD
jgi:hypothetical protein